MTKRKKKVHELLRLLESRGKLLIVTHENPDPDSIASGAALAHIAEAKLGIKPVMAYGGIIGHAENKAMVEILGIEMVEFNQSLVAFDQNIAVVDTQPEAGNLLLPPEVTPSIVIDHHPPTPVLSQVPFADVRYTYGATSTIMVDYFRELRLAVPSRLATALFYGIKTDTQDLSRHTSDEDRKAYTYLFRLVDKEALPKIEFPRLPRQYFETFRTAMERAYVYGEIVTSSLEEMDNPNAVAEAADLLLRLEGMTWSLCSGFYNDYLYVSLRTSNPDLSAGEVVKKAMHGLGSSGGHGVMAGGRAHVLPNTPEARAKALSQIETRFLTVLGADQEAKEKLLSLKPRGSSLVRLG